MTSRARISKLTLVRFAVITVTVLLVILNITTGREWLGMLGALCIFGFVIFFEIPRASRKQNNPDQ